MFAEQWVKESGIASDTEFVFAEQWVKEGGIASDTEFVFAEQRISKSKVHARSSRIGSYIMVYLL